MLARILIPTTWLVAGYLCYHFRVVNILRRKRYMMESANVKLLCQKNTLDRLALSMLGKNYCKGLPHQVTFQRCFYIINDLMPTQGRFTKCNTSIFDRNMFSLVWKPVLNAIAFAFTTFDDDYIVQNAIAAFRQCATLAGIFQLPDVFDYIVQSLSRVTSLLIEPSYISIPHHPVVEVEGREITVSSLSIRFGNDIKAQLAAVVLFTIANGNGNAIRSGWTQVDLTSSIVL